MSSKGGAKRLPMQEILRRYAEAVVRRAWIVLVGSLVVSALLATGVSRLVVDLDTESQGPPDHPFSIIDAKIRKEFGGRNFVAIAVVPQAGTIWRKDTLEIVHGITTRLLNAPGVIRQNVVSLSSPYVRVPKLDGGALGFDYVMREVPADEEGIRRLRELYEREPLFRGTLVSRDERAAMILVDFYDARGKQSIAAIVHEAVAPYRSTEHRIALTGHPIFEDEDATMMRQQGLYFGASMAAIFFVLYLAFGQLQGVIIPSLTAILSTVWSLGIMGFVGIPVTVWTAAAPLMVMTVAAGHSAQMLKRYYEEFARLGNREAAVIESTSRIGIVMMAAGGTAGCGFGALALLGIPALAHFGLAVAFGIFAAVILEMTFMLALRLLWPAGSDAAGEGPLARYLSLLLRPLETAASRHPGLVVAGFAVVAIAAAVGYPRLTTEFIAHNYPSNSTEAGRDLRLFEKHFPGTTTLTVLLEGEPGSMKSPEAMRLMRGLTAAMEKDPDVDRASSIADIIGRTYEVFAPEDAVGGLPGDANLLSQLFFLADSPAFERYVDRAYSHSVVLGFLKQEDSGVTRRVIDRLRDSLKTNPPETIRVSLAGGVGPTILALNEHTVKGKSLNIAVILLVIFTIASLLLRTAVGGAYMTSPLLMALVVNLGLFSWLGVAFDLVGASIAAINVGIGADYAIYFLYRLREEFRATGGIDEALHRTIETSGRAVLFVAFAVSAGFAVNIPSGFLGLRLMGTFVPATMIVTCLTALTLLPALVLLLRPGFIFRQEGEVAGEEEKRRRVAAR